MLEKYIRLQLFEKVRTEMKQIFKCLWTHHKAKSLKKGVEVCNVFVSLMDLKSANNHDSYDE